MIKALFFLFTAITAQGILQKENYNVRFYHFHHRTVIYWPSVLWPMPSPPSSLRRFRRLGNGTSSPSSWSLPPSPSSLPSLVTMTKKHFSVYGHVDLNENIHSKSIVYLLMIHLVFRTGSVSHNIFYPTVKDRTQLINRRCIKRFVFTESVYCRTGNIMIFDQRIGRFIRLFQCFLKWRINNHPSPFCIIITFLCNGFHIDYSQLYDYIG